MNFWRCCGALLALALLAACSRQTAEAGKITIRFWHGFTAKDGETMLEIVRRFNRENPGIEVRVQRIPWGTYYNKLFVAGLAGRAPDVFVCHASRLARLERGGFVEPVDELLQTEGGLDVNDLDAGVWHGVEIDGRHLGVPLDVHPMGLFYNRGLLRQAGIAPPKDFTEFMTALKKLNCDTNGDGRNDQWGFMIGSDAFYLAYTMMVQEGGGILSADGTRVVVDSPENRTALTKLRSLTAGGLVPPPGDETAWTSFLQGRVAMFFSGPYMAGSLEHQAVIDYAATVTPQFGPQRGSYGDSHTLCLPRGLPKEKQAAVWRFMTYLSNHSEEWAQGGQVPVRKSARASAAFRALKIQPVFAEEIGEVAYVPNVPAGNEIAAAVSTACNAVARGEQTPAEALPVAQREVEAILARDRAMEARILEQQAAWRKDAP